MCDFKWAVDTCFDFLRTKIALAITWVSVIAQNICSALLEERTEMWGMIDNSPNWRKKTVVAFLL